MAHKLNAVPYEENFPCVSLKPCISSKKKVFENNLHFLHQAKKMSIKPGIFRCRIGCRIFLALEVILHQ